MKIIKEAANILRTRSSAATPGPWRSWQGTAVRTNSSGGKQGFEFRADTAQNAAYIAMMNPLVGTLLADILENIRCDYSCNESGRWRISAVAR